MIPAQRRAAQRVTLVLPVPSTVTAPDLLATIDVLVRTTPKAVNAEVLAVLSPSVDESVNDLFQQLGGDLRHVTATQPLEDATAGAAAVISALQDERDTTAPICVVLDPLARPDLSDLTDRIDRLSPLHPAPLPFSHRPGALLARSADLVAATAWPVDQPGCQTLTVELAGRLAAIARRAIIGAADKRPDALHAESPASAPVSVVLVADAPTSTVEAAVAAVRKAAPGTDVVVVDPHGDAGRTSALQRLRGIRVVSGAGIHPVNDGIRHARGRKVAILDARAIVGRRFLDALSAALTDDVIAVGPRTNLDVGSQRADEVTYTSLPGFHAEAERHRRAHRGEISETTALTGLCLLLRRDDVLAAGGLDPALATPELAVLDLQLRLAASSQTRGTFRIAEEVLVHVSGRDAASQSGRWQLGGTGTALLRARHGDEADRLLPGVVAATLIVKDEVSRLGRCLETVTGLVDDVVVCDTGSKDDTIALAKALGATITHFDWCDDFAAARNAALTAHVGGWTLQVDADDQVVCADVAALRRQLDGLELDAVQVVYRTFADDSRDESASTDVLYERLFRADRCEYVGRLHEQVRRRDDGDAGKQARTDLLHFLHDGHREAVWEDKRARNARLTGLQHGTDGTETTDADSYGADSVWRSPFEAARIEGDPATADQLYAQALGAMPDWAIWAKVKALTGRALYAGNSGRHQDAARLGDEALALAPGDPAASVQVALARHALGDRAAACEVLRGVGTAVGSELVVVDRRMAEVYVPTMLGGLLLESGEAADVAEAISVLEATARRSPRAFDAYDVLATALRIAEPQGWPTRFAAIVADTTEATGSLPAALPKILNGLSSDDRSELQQALHAHGIGDADTAGAAGSAAWSRVEPRLRTLGRAEVAALAGDTEGKDPALALKMWEYVDRRTDSALGRARCLVALNELSAAGSALTGIVPAELAAPDVLFVATLAAQLGDVALARRLLDGMPPQPPGPLSAAAADLLQALDAALV